MTKTPFRKKQERETMPLYMYQAAYTPESWATQLRNPQNRAETVGHALCEAAGGKCLGAWYCFGEYDLMLIAEMPNAESMAAVALAVGAGGAIKSAITTVLMSGAECVAAMQKAATVAKSYTPAR
ncbi:MAG TPA: GYD domain-containing protein [Acetobacteraceae bacterium]|nr:GYD domain-containing protein [Acetobacteraceae bacterium]